MSTVSSFFDDGRPKPRGAVLFTGPDYMRDHRVRVEEQYYVGHGSMSPEASGNTNYICRAAPDVPHPPPKTARVGEIGWGVPGNADYSLLKNGNQIMLKEFRQANEDRYTHRYQSPYYPPPTHAAAVPPALATKGNPTLYQSVGTAGVPDEREVSTHSSHTTL